MKNSSGLLPTLRNVTLIALLSASAVARADVTLSSGNSVATINFGSGPLDSLGMNSWSINGQNQLHQQWFWFGLGNAAQNPLNTMPSVVVTPGPNGDFVSALYTDTVNKFSIMIDYTLAGGQTGGNDWTSDITENIKILNNSSSSDLKIRFYQYSDFNLGGISSGDTVTISQIGVSFSKATQTQGASRVSETIDNPLATRAEAGLTTDSPNTRDHLQSGSAYDLNNVLTRGPGDATWALQWNFDIAPGQSQDVVKDKQLNIQPIPEPSVVAVASLGLFALVCRWRRPAA